MESDGSPQDGTEDNSQGAVEDSSELRRNFVDPKRKARRYQVEVLDKALEENTIIFLETGCGKTLIAVLLIEALSHLIRKPSRKIAVFLVPNRALVEQQAKEIEEHTDLAVGRYWGSMGNGYSLTCEWWQEQLIKYEVIVLTPQILFNNLHHCLISMEMIELLIFDECHHAQKRHPYANIMRDFYHGKSHHPKIFGLTASPVIGKVKRGEPSVKIDCQIQKLENMLDAKLYTLKDRMELETLLPNPNEYIRVYQPSYEIDFVKQLGDMLRDLRNKYLNSSEVSFGQWQSLKPKRDVAQAKKEIDDFSKVYRMLEYCIYELGLWCTIKVAEILLNKEGQCFGTELIVMPTKESFLREAISKLKEADPTGTCLNCEFQEDDRLDIDNILMSPKLLCLVQLMEESRENYQKCIIFVDWVVGTTALSSVLNRVKCLSFLRSLPLVGSQAMSTKSQQQTIEKFRNNEVNLLVATEIAEEGLDIQSCFMVVRFDGAPKTTKSFIQSRGRARQKGSTYVVLVERGNQGQLNEVKQLKVKEKLMWEFTDNRGDTPVVLGEPETYEVELFEVESTGAMVTTDYSLQLLHRYCSKLPGDEFYRPIPEFSYVMDCKGVACEITLPSTAPVQLVKGHLCQTEKMARRVAALEACRKLHENGALTDYLLPASEFNEETEQGPNKQNLPSDPTAQMELHATSIPEALQGQWAAASTKISLFAYALHVFAEPRDREYAEFALFLEVDLDDNTKATVTELLLTKGRTLKIHLEPCGKVEFDINQLRDAQRFQERIFSITLERKLLQGFPSLPTSGHWDSRRLYLTLPLSHSQSPPAVDWKCVKNILSEVNFGSLLNSQDEGDDHTVENPDTSESTGQAQTFRVFQMLDGCVPVESLINSIVETTYNGRAYCVVGVLWDMNAYSEFVGDPKKYSSYVEFYKKRHNRKIEHSEQPLLQAKPLAKLHNLLVKRNDKDRDKDSAIKPEMLVELPPEFCSLKVLGFPTQVVNTVSLIPSFMHRIEYTLLATQLLQKLRASFSEAAKVSPQTVLQALTTAKCQQKYDYERLELFGDSFLKFAVSKQLFLIHDKKHEGALTKMRDNVICNSFLHSRGVALDLPMYILDELFDPLHWSAPGRPYRFKCNAETCAGIHTLHAGHASNPNHVKCSEGHRWLQKKRIADVVEAFIGGHLVDGGPDVALAFMTWLGIDVHFDTRLLVEASTRCVGDIRYIQGKNLSELEGILKYEFQNKALLVEALTHSSYQVPFGNCYQRLEFLGDAVLDFLITSHLYEAFPDLGPGGLTDLRSATVCNECFARVAVRYHLERFLLHDNPNLAQKVEDFVVLVHKVSSGIEKFYGWGCERIPKVLGDLVESLAGAVLVDTGFDTEKVWAVFEPLMQPIVTPDTLRLHPVRELMELCHMKNFTLDPQMSINKAKKVAKFIVHAGQKLVETQVEKLDKKTAQRLAAYEMLEKLKDLDMEWQHPYRTLTNTLISQGRLEPFIQVTEVSMDLTDELENLSPSDQVDGEDNDYHAQYQSLMNSLSLCARTDPSKVPESDGFGTPIVYTQRCDRRNICQDLDELKVPPFSYVDSEESDDGHSCELSPRILDHNIEKSRPEGYLSESETSLCVHNVQGVQVDPSARPMECNIPVGNNEQEGSLETPTISNIASLLNVSREGDDILAQGRKLQEVELFGQTLRKGQEKEFTGLRRGSDSVHTPEMYQLIAQVLKLGHLDWLEESQTNDAIEGTDEDSSTERQMRTQGFNQKFPSVDVPTYPEAPFYKPFSSERLVSEEINNTSQDVMTRNCPVDCKFDKAGYNDSDNAFEVSSDVQTLIDDLISQPVLHNHRSVAGPELMQTDLEETYEGAGNGCATANAYLNPEQNRTSTPWKQHPSGLCMEVNPRDEQLGRSREELHNLCAKYKWKMPYYEPCQDYPKGPPHARRFAYFVKVSCSLKDTGQTCEYDVECEGEPMSGTRGAMDSAALCAINWLKESGKTFAQTRHLS